MLCAGTKFQAWFWKLPSVPLSEGEQHGSPATGNALGPGGRQNDLGVGASIASKPWRSQKTVEIFLELNLKSILSFDL